MARINFPITLDKLISDAIEARKRYGNKYVLISNDEEGNGYHECYYSFTETDGFGTPEDLDPKDCIILG